MVQHIESDPSAHSSQSSLAAHQAAARSPTGTPSRCQLDCSARRLQSQESPFYLPHRSRKATASPETSSLCTHLGYDVLLDFHTTYSAPIPHHGPLHSTYIKHTHDCLTFSNSAHHRREGTRHSLQHREFILMGGKDAKKRVFPESSIHTLHDNHTFV